jgi:hypothetical protein
VNEDRLYRSLDRLLPHKEELERHLKNRLGELFDLDYDLLLYELAQRGYSRDHRPDCKQVNIALVVSREGMPLGYQLFTGGRKNFVRHLQMFAYATAFPGCWAHPWVWAR